MACKYQYNGQEYSKEDLIEELTNTLFKDLSTNNVFRSIAIKEKPTDVISDTITVLNQRYQDARNMVQAIKNSDASKIERLKKMAQYKKIMADSNAARKELILTSGDKQLDWVMDKALADAKLVEALYNSKKITYGELQFAYSVVSTWVNLKNSIGINTIYDLPDTPKGLIAREKLSKILDVYNAFDERTRSIAIELIKQSMYGQEVTDKDIKELVDTSAATLWTRELTTTGIPLANKMAFIIKDVNFKINKEHASNHAEIDRRFATIKDNPLFKKEGWNLFVKTEKNKNDAPTLGLTTRYTQIFWDNMKVVNKLRRDRIERAGGDKVKVKAAWTAYNDWIQKNTVPFDSRPFLQMEKYTDSQRISEVERMKTLGFNESEINSIIAESIRLNDRFIKNMEEYEHTLRLNVTEHPEMIPTGMTEDQWVEHSLEEYDNLNNPLKYTEQKFTPGEIITAYGGARYSYLIAAKTVDGKDLNYYDENFSKISADPALHEFYTWFSDFMKQNLSWLPEEEIDDLHSNFLPVIADRTAKEYGFSALKESVKGLGDWFMRSLTDNNYGQKVEKNPMSNEERRSFKARFIDDNVDIQERSKDLSVIAKLFSDMALVYKHKNTVKSEIDTINQVLLGTKGSYEKNKGTGEYERTAKDASNIKKLADYTVRTGFYGLKAPDRLWKSETKFYDWRELVSLGFWKSKKAKDAKRLSEEISTIKKQIEEGNLSYEDMQDKQSELNNKEQELYRLGGRSLSLTAFLDSTAHQTRLVSLGFSPLAAIRNLLIGKINNAVHMVGGRDFNRSDWNWANRTIKSGVTKYWTGGKLQTHTTKLIFGLMSDAQLAEGEDSIYIKSVIDKHTPLDKLREATPKLFTWLASGDYHFKAETLLSCMKHEIITTEKGEKISFYEGLTEDREWNEEKYGKWDTIANSTKTDSEGNKIPIEFDQYYREHLNKYKQVAFKLHGAVGGGVVIYGKQNALGRVMFLFKSWLPETVGNRFDPRHRDALLDRDEEGYYRTFGRLVQEKRFGVIKTILQTMLHQDNGIVDELDLANFKKAVAEFSVIVTGILLYMVARAMTPDDDEKKKLWNLLIVRNLYDLNRDMGYYSSISSVEQLGQNVIPVFRTMDNWYSAMQAIGFHMFGVENKAGDGEMFDAERTWLKITKCLPVFSNINRIKYYMKDISIVSSSGGGGGGGGLW